MTIGAAWGHGVRSSPLLLFGRLAGGCPAAVRDRADIREILLLELLLARRFAVAALLLGVSNRGAIVRLTSGLACDLLLLASNEGTVSHLDRFLSSFRFLI